MDARIEEVVGKPVAEIFADDGEARFRALEESATLELLETGEVVSLGGGAVMNPRIREAWRGTTSSGWRFPSSRPPAASGSTSLHGRSATSGGGS